MFKSLLKWIKYMLLALAGVLALYFTFAFYLSLITVNRNFIETPAGIPIYVCSNGVHTDIAVPVKTDYVNWNKQFPTSAFKLVDSTFQYIEFGWGNKGFYLNTPTWADLKFKTAYKALFFLDSSAMHVTYNKYPPVVTPGACQKISISPQQYRQLINYIQTSFNLHADTVVVFPGKGYDVTDNFYQAMGHYSFLKTCNVWTCNALKSAGIRQPLWSPFQGGVMAGYSTQVSNK